METIYLCIIIFLFVLAVFDLMVGVSNDAVNFLNSAVGAKAASFKTILFIAGAGIFIGASLSNGMMDIARHGIYQPEHFYFAEIMCILLAVMLTDVVLLDVFNSMGMPTSTTVSMVFELLGGTFALALIKVHNSDTLGLGVGIPIELNTPTKPCLSSWPSLSPLPLPSFSVCLYNGWHAWCLHLTTRAI